MRLIYMGIALACLLCVAAAVEPIPLTSSERQTFPTPNELPTVSENTADDDNSTVPVLQITDYHYFDWPKIGYQIFMRKIIEAFGTLKYFMSLDPMVLKITRTFILTNDTDLDFINENSTDENGNAISTTEDQSVETNTESPIKFAISLNSEESDREKKQPLYRESIPAHNSKESKKDDVTKTKTETGGFFSGLASAVATFYHTLTGWF